jgi:hypothetical protein
MKKRILIILLLVIYFTTVAGYAEEGEKLAYMGFKSGAFSLDRGNSMNIFSFGGTAGCILPFENKYIEVALEWDFNLGYFGGDHVSGYSGDRTHARTVGVYGVVRTVPVNEVYAKGKIGVTDETVFKRINNEEVFYKEEGLSFGIGAGYRAGGNAKVEVEFTSTNSNMKFLSLSLMFLL